MTSEIRCWAVRNLLDDELEPRISVPRDLQIENLKREVETLRAELEKIKMEVRGVAQGGPREGGPHMGKPGVHPPGTALQAQRYISQLKGQVNGLEAELEEQRKQKQKALVDNEQLRHELAQLKALQLEGARNQGLLEEAESVYLWGGTQQQGEGWLTPCLPTPLSLTSPQGRPVPRRHATAS